MFEIHYTKGTQMCADESTFNSLPVEIIKEIFCDFGSAELFDMKLVCSFWRIIIQDILNIQILKVPIERYTNAVNVVDIACDVVCAFQISQAPCRIRNLIGEKIIRDQIGCYEINILRESSFSKVLKLLEGANKNSIFAHEPGWFDFREITVSAWINMIAMTEKEYDSGNLTNKSNRSTEEEVETSMAKFRWYTLSADFDYSCVQGVVALYPDSRTFATIYGFQSRLPPL